MTTINYDEMYIGSPFAIRPEALKKYIILNGRGSNKQRLFEYAYRDVFTKTIMIKVIFNGPATIIIDTTGKKAVVKCMDGEKPTKMKGFVMCLCKYLLTSTDWNHIIRPISKPKVEYTVAKALCEYILGCDTFNNLVKEYVK